MVKVDITTRKFICQGTLSNQATRKMSMKTILYISKKVWEWVDVFTISNGASTTSTLE